MCCISGLVDECGVCDGDGTRCVGGWLGGWMRTECVMEIGPGAWVCVWWGGGEPGFCTLAAYPRDPLTHPELAVPWVLQPLPWVLQPATACVMLFPASKPRTLRHHKPWTLSPSAVPWVLQPVPCW